MEIKNKKNLPIPVQVSNEKQTITGFGKKEMRITGFSFLIAIGIGIITFILSGEIIVVFVPVIIILPITVMLIKKDVRNESFINKVQVILRFSRTQKRYEYVYHNIYEGD